MGDTKAYYDAVVSHVNKTGGAAVWASRTGGNPGARAVLQAGDGNLVELWQPGTPPA